MLPIYRGQYPQQQVRIKNQSENIYQRFLSRMIIKQPGHNIINNKQRKRQHNRSGQPPKKHILFATVNF